MGSLRTISSLPALSGAFVAALLALLAGASVAAAQGVVRITVHDTAGAAIAGADVAIENGPRPVRSPGAVFLFRGVASGQHRLAVRAVGYTPWTRDLELAEADSIDVTIVLTKLAQELAPLIADAPATTISPRMRGFEERRLQGNGKFFTRAELALVEHSSLDNLLRSVTGIHLVRRPSGCGGGFALASGRGGQSLVGQYWMACLGAKRGSPDTTFPVACYYAIYVDGSRLWSPGDYEPPNMQTFYTLAALDGIEVYRGPAELPT